METHVPSHLETEKKKHEEEALAMKFHSVNQFSWVFPL